MSVAGARPGVCMAGARPERTLHVGDIYHADVVGARAAGVHALLLDPHGDWPELACERAVDLFSWGHAFVAVEQTIVAVWP